jgi:hypothetical protein
MRLGVFINKLVFREDREYVKTMLLKMMMNEVTKLLNCEKTSSLCPILEK